DRERDRKRAIRTGCEGAREAADHHANVRVVIELVQETSYGATGGNDGPRLADADPDPIGDDEDVEADHQPREQADLEAGEDDAEVEEDAERGRHEPGPRVPDRRG